MHHEMSVLDDLNQLIQDAVDYFWSTRTGQIEKQRALGRKIDAGIRGAVTGGKQMSAFEQLALRIALEQEFQNVPFFSQKHSNSLDIFAL